MRTKVSERERYPIESSYYLNITGELEERRRRTSSGTKLPQGPCAARGNWECLRQPRKADKALEESEEAIRLDRNRWPGFL